MRPHLGLREEGAFTAVKRAVVRVYPAYQSIGADDREAETNSITSHGVIALTVQNGCTGASLLRESLPGFRTIRMCKMPY